MSHPFGDLLTQHLHRKHGLSQSKLAAGILQPPSIISEMCQGKRLQGSQARERVVAIIEWLQKQGALTTLDEANALLNAAGMVALQQMDATKAILIQQLLTAPVQNGKVPTSVSLHSPLVAPRHNLPVQLTAFIGRAEQIAQLAQYLPARRLLTLTGAGGVGKTRLALEVATRLLAGFSDGVWFVDLASLTDPSAIPQRILDLWRVPEPPARSPLALLTTYLHSKQMLLILDNCEHLLDACATVAETLLQQCPRLSLLATSREALNIRAELSWRVPSLTRPRFNGNGSTAPVPSPRTPTALLAFEAVTLFVERVQSHQPGFALTSANANAVAHICSRLDGIPLALEMAAARVNVFTIEELATRLDGVFDARFQLLTSGSRTAPFRHQTLRATLEWSYNLLTPAEQWLLRRLSVFRGGWTASATETVTGCSLDLLAQLVNKSLVIADQQAGQTRYRLLESVRQFATEQIRVAEDEQHQVQWQHSRYYLHLLSAQEQPLQSPQQRPTLALIRRDFANISAAWGWAVEQRAFALLAPALHALFLFCEVSGSFRTGMTLFAQATRQLQTALAPNATELAASATDGLRPAYEQSTLQLLWGRLIVRLGICEVMLGDFSQSEQHLQAGLLATAVEQEHALALVYLAWAADERGEVAEATVRKQASLAISQRGNDLVGMATVLRQLSAAQSDHPAAWRFAAESLRLWRQVGRPDRIANLLGFSAWHLFCLGEYATATAYWREDLALCEQFDLPNEKAWALDCLGFLAWFQGEMATAEQTLRAALVLYTELGRQSMIGSCQAELSLVLASIGQVGQALTMAQEAVAITRAVNSQLMLTLSLNHLGAVLARAGDWSAARDTLREAIQRGWQNQYFFFLMEGFYFFAELLVRESAALEMRARFERKSLALTLLSCVRAQPATWRSFKDKAAQLQAEIEDALPAELRTTAIARGQSCSLEELVKTLLEQVDVW